MEYFPTCSLGFLYLLLTVGLINEIPNQKVVKTEFPDRIEYSDRRNVIYADRMPISLGFRDDKSNGPGIDSYQVIYGNAKGKWLKIDDPCVSKDVRDAASTVEEYHKKHKAQEKNKTFMDTFKTAGHEIEIGIL